MGSFSPLWHAHHAAANAWRGGVPGQRQILVRPENSTPLAAVDSERGSRQDPSMSRHAIPSTTTISTANLADWLIDARRRTLELIGDLTDEQLLGPPLPTVNPLLWEIGHLAWFHEKWVLRHVHGSASASGRCRPALRLRCRCPRHSLGPAAALPSGNATLHGPGAGPDPGTAPRPAAQPPTKPISSSCRSFMKTCTARRSSIPAKPLPIRVPRLDERRAPESPRRQGHGPATWRFPAARSCSEQSRMSSSSSTTRSGRIRSKSRRSPLPARR